MSVQWYCKFGENQFGPYSTDQIQTMARDGRLTPDTPVRRGTSGEWRKSQQIVGFAFPGTDAIKANHASDATTSAIPQQPPTSHPRATAQPIPTVSRPTASPKWIWIWVTAATLGVCLLGCCGISFVFLAILGSSEEPTGGGSARLNVSGVDATDELQMLATTMSDEEKMALGLAVLLTGSDVYAARVQITNTGDVPVRVFPENLLVHFNQESAKVYSFDNPPFLQAGVLQPGYYCEGLVAYEARVDIGAAMRFGAGSLSYNDPTIEVTYNQ